MFGWLKKDPTKSLQKEYQDLLKKGMELQRGGDIKGFAEIMAKAETVMKKIEAIKTT